MLKSGIFVPSRSGVIAANSAIIELTLPSSAKIVTEKDLYSEAPIIELEFPRSSVTEIELPEGQYL